MPPENFSTFIAWWGAALSTLLAIVKLMELWRDRFRLDIGATLTGDESTGHKIHIRNLSQKPLILLHRELFYCSGRRLETLEPIASREFDDGDLRIEPHGSQTLQFVDADHFPWSYLALKGRGICIRVYFAGRKPILHKVYPQ